MGRDSAAAALPGAEGCGCAGATTPCPLPALVALLGWLCHKSIPVYVTGSLSQALGALERSLWICNFVLLPHLIFHSPSNAFLCQRQRLAGGSATDICIIRLGSRACAQRGEQGSSCAPSWKYRVGKNFWHLTFSADPADGYGWWRRTRITLLLEILPQVFSKCKVWTRVKPSRRALGPRNTKSEVVSSSCSKQLPDPLNIQV